MNVLSGFFCGLLSQTVAIQDAQGKSHGAIGSQKDIYIYMNHKSNSYWGYVTNFAKSK